MRDKYGVDQDKYCYQGTDVLINRLNIKNADDLDEAEAKFTSQRYKNYQRCVYNRPTNQTYREPP